LELDNAKLREPTPFENWRFYLGFGLGVVVSSVAVYGAAQLAR